MLHILYYHGRKIDCHSLFPQQHVCVCPQEKHLFFRFWNLQSAFCTKIAWIWYVIRSAFHWNSRGPSTLCNQVQCTIEVYCFVLTFCWLTNIAEMLGWIYWSPKQWWRISQDFFKENLLCKSCTWVMSRNKRTELLTPIYRFMRYNKDNRIYPKIVPNFRVNYFRSFIKSSKRKSITSFSIFRLFCSSLHQKIVVKFLNFKQNFLLI